MAALPETLPSKNHNNPPSDLEILSEQLAIRHVALIREAERHEKLGKKIPEKFTDQSEANFTADFIKEATHCQKSLESTRKEEKEPYLRQGQFVDTFFKTEVDKLENAITAAKKPLNIWLQQIAAQEQKRRQDEAERLHKEAELSMAKAAVMPSTETMQNAIDSQAVADKCAAVPIVTMAAASGSFSKAGLKKKWVGTIIDIASVDLEKLRAYIKPEALQVALNAYVKMGGRDCKGAKIAEELEVGVK